MNPVKKVAILSKGPAKKGQSVEKVVVLSTDGLGIVRYQPPLGPPGASGVLLACTRGSAAHQKGPNVPGNLSAGWGLWRFQHPNAFLSLLIPC